MSLGTRVAQLRKARGLSQKALAALAGLRVQNLCRLEQRPTRHVRSDVLIRLCQALGISADYLLGLGEDSPGHLVYDPLPRAVPGTPSATISAPRRRTPPSL